MPSELFEAALKSLIAEDTATAEQQIHEYFVQKAKLALAEASPAKVVTIKVKVPEQFFQLGAQAKAEFMDVVAEKAEDLHIPGKPKVIGDYFVFNVKGFEFPVEEVKTVQADLTSEVEDSLSEFLADKSSEILERILPAVRDLTGLKALKKKSLFGFFIGGSTSAREDEALSAAFEEHGYTAGSYTEDKAFFTKIGLSKEDYQLLAAASM
jgi:Tfp pilus assembly PilM family ATPase